MPADRAVAYPIQQREHRRRANFGYEPLCAEVSDSISWRRSRVDHRRTVSEDLLTTIRRSVEADRWLDRLQKHGWPVSVSGASTAGRRYVPFRDDRGRLRATMRMESP
jgi:hypothetical protein